MDLVVQLHSHLPWVLGHGDWPHGSDWLSEATLETYLPLIEQLRTLGDEGVAAPVTLGITPILANQLGHASFRGILEKYAAQRAAAHEEQAALFEQRGETDLAWVARWHGQQLERLRALWTEIDGDILGAFKGFADAGRIELTSSAATHAFLPMLGRDESIRFQLRLGFAEHRRIFGVNPVGCWLPECAYRPAGWWEPLHHAPHRGMRHGTEQDVLDAGFRYVTLDAPLVAGRDKRHRRPPYRAYGIRSDDGSGALRALVRDPRTAAQVWSADGGYPGDGAYLEFHKQHWPGGLKLWRVTARNADLGDKLPYWPEVAEAKVREHAGHFATLLGAIAREQHPWGTTLITAPFDTELFGHWWFEGPQFLGQLYRELRHHPQLRPTTGSWHLIDNPDAPVIPVDPGSWGAHSDWSTWVGAPVAYMWRRLWPLEDRFWQLVPRALGDERAHVALAQAARTFVLAQSSDWPFIVTMGQAADYGAHRFHSHCADLDRLLDALSTALEAGGSFETANAIAAELATRDDPFPDVLPHLAAALA
ncbi:MAG: DUF1957 domain-containing protein [Gemmatimonadaceae bacterium]|nr:DUF1957 domain-containing protein [Gemmatimonadaceae bacterium]